MRSNSAAENERLKQRLHQLQLDNYELTRIIQNERILVRSEEAAARRAERLAASKARLESRAAQRLQVMEAAAVKQANLHIKQLQEVLNVYGPQTKNRIRRDVINNLRRLRSVCPRKRAPFITFPVAAVNRRCFL